MSRYQPYLLMCAMLLLGSLAQVHAVDANDRDFVDEGFTDGTDQLGMLWDFSRGTGGSVWDGSNDIFDNGMRLHIEENANLQAMSPWHNFRNQQPTPTRVRRHRQTGEWVVDVPSASLQVQRRVRLFPEGYVRYVEVLTNPGKSAIPVQVHIFSDLGTSVQSIMDDQGRNLGQTQGAVPGDVRGFAITQGGRNDLVWYAGEKNEKIQRYMQHQHSYHMLSYAFTLEPEETKAITYTVGQRSAGSGINEDFVAHASSSEMYRDLPRAIRRALLNGPSLGIGAGAVYTLDEMGIAGDASHTVFAQGESTRLLGSLDWTAARMRTAYGEHAFPVAEVVGLTGTAFDPRHQVVFLRDGQILSGALELEDFAFKHSSGFTMVDQAHMIDRVLAPGADVDNYEIDGWSVVLVDGNRLRLHPPHSEQGLQLRSPWGDLSLPLRAIQYLIRPDDDELLAWHLRSADGQIMRVYPLQATMRVESELFGALDIPLASILGFMAPALPGSDEDSDQPAPQSGAAVVTMVDGARLMGSLSWTNLHLLDHQYQPIRIPLQQIRRVETDAGRATVIFHDGSRVTGSWDRTHVPIVSRDRELAVPVNAVSEIELATAALSPAERALVLDLVQSLASRDWVEREEATRALRSMGASVHALLERQMTHSQDPEVQHRLTLILKGE